MEKYFYEVDLNEKWEKGYSMTAYGLKEIEVNTPLSPWKGKKTSWTAEQLLGGSVSTCFMNTFLELAEACNLEVKGYHSQCFIKQEKVNGKYITKEILLRPVIQLLSEYNASKTYKCIEDAEKTSPVINALNIQIEINFQVDILNKTTKVKVGH